MGGMFGVVSKEECAGDMSAIYTLFYGTDYHSHLGTQRGGLASLNGDKFYRFIHDITNDQFRSRFKHDIGRMRGSKGIGVISDNEDQPLVINSHLGEYAIASVNKINNLDELVHSAFLSRRTHFAETGRGVINPTEVVATLINQEGSFADGIRSAQEAIKGSCSMILLTKEGIYAVRDELGRTPLVIGRGKGRYGVASESCAFPNTDFEVERELGAGEIVLINAEGVEQKRKPESRMQICSFLWVYFGYPASTYEGRNVEIVRNRCGAALARADAEELKSGKLKIDFVAGIPDSGTGHALGYANESKIPYMRPFVKYTPTWPRSFMPQDQETRNLVAKMKLIPIREIINGASMLFDEDSIVRGTQLRDIISILYKNGAREVHMRPACPPLIYGCEFLNFSRSRSVLDLAGQRAIHAIEGLNVGQMISKELLTKYKNEDSEAYRSMVEWIRDDLKLTTLKYQRLNNLVWAIGLPKERLCTHCWDGSSYF